jgi:acyl-CoA dehydrogenase
VTSLSNQDYAPLAEIMGRVPWASEVFNCSAPDTGNMEVLERYGTPEHKEALARAAARTEDPQRLRDDRAGRGLVRRHQHPVPHRARRRRVRDQRPQVVDLGRRRPALQVYILMGKTDPEAPRHSQQSMILVPMDAPGVKVLRPLTVFGYDDAPHGHMEVTFDERARAGSNILLGEGRGFEIAQGRLGPWAHPPLHAPDRPGRTRARADVRTRFGARGVRQADLAPDRHAERIAEARCQIDMARLLTLKAAWMMDVAGNKTAKAEIAMIKVVAPNMACRVIDWAMQVLRRHGHVRRRTAGLLLYGGPYPALRRRARRSASQLDRQDRAGQTPDEKAGQRRVRRSS